MNQKLNKEFYISTGFAVFVFVLTFLFFREYVFQSYLTFSSFFSSIIGALISLILTWLLKNKSVFYKVVVIVIYLICIALFSYNSKNISSIKNNIAISANINSLKGNWIASENNLILRLNISDKEIKMNFHPNNKQLVFDYEVNEQVIDLFNDEDISNFQWKILKHTNDSLVVMEKNQILKFKKEK